MASFTLVDFLRLAVRQSIGNLQEISLYTPRCVKRKAFVADTQLHPSAPVYSRQWPLFVKSDQSRSDCAWHDETQHDELSAAPYTGRELDGSSGTVQ